MRAALFLGVVWLTSTCLAQPAIDWQRNYGGSSGDGGRTISPTDDGGYIVLGRTTSSDGQVVGYHGLDDLWVIKLGASGELQWQICLGGSEMEYGGDIRQTHDGGYILIGSTDSNDGDITSSTGTTDVWVAKLTAAGILDWEHCYGGSGADYGRCLQLLPNGDYLLFGETGSPEIAGFHGGRDLWLARISSSGELLEQRCYGGTEQDMAGYFAALPSGRLLISGAVWSNDGDVSGNHGGTDAWVVSLDENWDIDWQLCLGGSAGDYAHAICTAPSNEIFVACASNSTNGDITDFWGDEDYWIARLSSDGALINSASFGGSGVDAPRSIVCDPTNTLFVLGISYSADGLVSIPQGGADAWLLSLDENLELNWERSQGGSGSDSGSGSGFGPAGEVVFVGSSNSTDGDLTGNFGSSDLWVVKLQPVDVGMGETTALAGFSVFPNPTSTELRVNLSTTGAKLLELIDVTGRVIYHHVVAAGAPQVQLQVADLAQGTYTVRLSNTEGSFTQRFIKY